MPLDDETATLIDELISVLRRVQELPAHCLGALVSAEANRAMGHACRYVEEHQRTCRTCGNASGLHDLCTICFVEAHSQSYHP